MVCVPHGISFWHMPWLHKVAVPFCFKSEMPDATHTAVSQSSVLSSGIHSFSGSVRSPLIPLSSIYGREGSFSG